VHIKWIVNKKIRIYVVMKLANRILKYPRRRDFVNRLHKEWRKTPLMAGVIFSGGVLIGVVRSLAGRDSALDQSGEKGVR
jgi:UDP-N-acetylmuramyl pentapeptide phosphotransferase/UDP-N-acetylglucosamine-1-phosphate transferase